MYASIFPRKKINKCCLVVLTQSSVRCTLFRAVLGSTFIVYSSLTPWDMTCVVNNQMKYLDINPLSANFTKWSNTLKQFVGKLPTNCLSVFDHFVGLALKRLTL